MHGVTPLDVETIKGGEAGGYPLTHGDTLNPAKIAWHRLLRNLRPHNIHVYKPNSPEDLERLHTVWTKEVRVREQQGGGEHTHCDLRTLNIVLGLNTNKALTIRG